LKDSANILASFRTEFTRACPISACNLNEVRLLKRINSLLQCFFITHLYMHNLGDSKRSCCTEYHMVKVSKLFFYFGNEQKRGFQAVLNRGKIKLPISVCKIGAGKMVNLATLTNHIHCTVCILADQTHFVWRRGQFAFSVLFA